jgi:isoleucyl-tRNA synthetase
VEEAWTSRFAGEDESVHLQDFPATPKGWADEALIEKWKRIRAFRRVVTGAVEIERAAKNVGSSLEAFPIAYINESEWPELDKFPAQDIAITSSFATDALKNAPTGAFSLPDVPNIVVVVNKADGEKCDRCWRVLPEVAANQKTRHKHLCDRCTDAVGTLANVPA